MKGRGFHGRVIQFLGCWTGLPKVVGWMAL